MPLLQRQSSQLFFLYFKFSRKEMVKDSQHVVTLMKLLTWCVTLWASTHLVLRQQVFQKTCICLQEPSILFLQHWLLSWKCCISVFQMQRAMESRPLWEADGGLSMSVFHVFLLCFELMSNIQIFTFCNECCWIGVHLDAFSSCFMNQLSFFHFYVFKCGHKSTLFTWNLL